MKMMREIYLWQQNDWPNFVWDDVKIRLLLEDVHRQQGVLLDRMSLLGMEQRNQSLLEAMSNEIINSSSIEGEKLYRLKMNILRKSEEGGRSTNYWLK